MSEYDMSRRKLLAGLGSATVGGVALVTQSRSASAELTTETTYNVQDQTTETVGEIEAIRLVVDATIKYTAEQEVTTLGCTLSVGQQNTDSVETLDTSILQRSATEGTVEQTMTANLGEIVTLSDLRDSTTAFTSELYVFAESDGQRIAEATVPETFSLTLEDGEIESSLSVQAEGTIEVSQSG